MCIRDRCLLAGALYLRNKPAIRNALILRSTRLCKLASHVESYLFAGYMVELLKQGIPTRTALQYLEQIRKGSLFCELHKHLMNGLQNGEDILCVICLLYTSYCTAHNRHIYITVYGLQKGFHFIYNRLHIPRCSATGRAGNQIRRVFQ